MEYRGILVKYIRDGVLTNDYPFNIQYHIKTIISLNLISMVLQNFLKV